MLSSSVVEVRHLIVTDGAFENFLSCPPDVHVLNLPKRTGDFGDTPRAVGSMYALSLRANLLSYLDADNWVVPDHLASILDAIVPCDALVITTKRQFAAIDGRPLGAICLTSNGIEFCDTNCLTLYGAALRLGLCWGDIHPGEHAIDDRVVWGEIRKSSIPCIHTDLATVFYRANSAGIYHDLGLTPPDDARSTSSISEALRLHFDRTGRDLTLRWKYLLLRDA
jgi:hypothetical protein